MPKYKFADLVYNITEKRLPVAGDEVFYIGLEHLDSGKLKVTRWGSKVAIKGEKLAMKKGDILFGRRNTYLRRVAIAPHDGIFSAHGMIFRPKKEVINEDFFPFFIASDYFMDEAIRISVGSLSPTVNWGELKELEFEIPSLEKQKELAKILVAANQTKENYEELLLKTDELVKSQFIEMFGDPELNPKSWPIKSLSEVAESFIGLTYKPKDVSPNGTIVLRSSNIQDSEIYLDDQVRVNTVIKEKLYVEENDILMCSRNGSASLVGKVAKIPKLSERMTFGAFMTIIRSRYSDYLFIYFQLPAFRKQVNTRTATINQITQKMLDNVRLPIPEFSVVERFSKLLTQTDKSKFELKKAIENINVLIKSLMQKDYNN